MLLVQMGNGPRDSLSPIMETFNRLRCMSRGDLGRSIPYNAKSTGSEGTNKSCTSVGKSCIADESFHLLSQRLTEIYSGSSVRRIKTWVAMLLLL